MTSFLLLLLSYPGVAMNPVLKIFLIVCLLRSPVSQGQDGKRDSEPCFTPCTRFPERRRPVLARCDAFLVDQVED